MKPEIYFYNDFPNDKVIVGTRGVSEYKVDRRTFEREFLRRRVDGSNVSDYDRFKGALKIAIELSQCVEFEEVKPIPCINGPIPGINSNNPTNTILVPEGDAFPIGTIITIFREEVKPK